MITLEDAFTKNACNRCGSPPGIPCKHDDTDVVARVIAPAMDELGKLRLESDHLRTGIRRALENGTLDDETRSELEALLQQDG